MFEKMTLATMTTYYKAKAKLAKLRSDESGMETIETVLLIAVAVVVALVILNALTGGEGQQGIVQRFFTKLEQSITDIFDTTPAGATPAAGGANAS